MPLLLLQAAAPPARPDFLTTAFPFLLMGLIGWFFIFRPMTKEKKEKQAMRDALKAGDKVLTIGGMYGRVTKLDDKSVFVRVADGVQVELTRLAVVSIIPEGKE